MTESIGQQAQIKGKKAEGRVIYLARRMLGLSAEPATAEQDYGQKTDAVIGGIPIQVSSSPKSKGEQKRLSSRGIKNVAGGSELSDEQVIANIRKAIEGG